MRLERLSQEIQEAMTVGFWYSTGSKMPLVVTALVIIKVLLKVVVALEAAALHVAASFSCLLLSGGPIVAEESCLVSASFSIFWDDVKDFAVVALPFFYSVYLVFPI